MASPQRPDRPFDIVVFDLGGVLVRIVQSWDEAHARSGLPPHAILDDEAFRVERAGLAQLHQLGAIESAVYCERISRASGGAYSPADVERVLAAWHWTEYPGVDAVVNAIEAAGVATGALSNTNPLHWAELRPASGEPRFPTVSRLQHAHASHLLRMVKPDRAIYAAFEGATRFSGARILFFDDLAENVEAARAAGWAAEHIDPRGDTAAQLRAHLARRCLIEG